MADKMSGLDFEMPILELESRIQELQKLSNSEGIDFKEEISTLEEKCEKLKKETYGSLTSWQKVLLARHPKRPYGSDYIDLIFNEFTEIHGDRAFADDGSLITGFAYLDNYKVMIVAHQKGRNIQESMMRNFGMPHPEGYRKALRVMKLAEKFGFPVISFIDTPGAYPGIGAEERGQANAIAENLREMALLKVPTISIVIGEGGSGGALAIGVTDKILMLENSYYSVISPEGCAAILFRDSSKAPEASKALKITADDLLKIGIIDEVVKEPDGGAHRDYINTAQSIKEVFLRYLNELTALPLNSLLKKRLEKYRNIGAYKTESKPKKANKTQEK
ncbi:MAG: acetyl-CoA carboxylase carboxyltransferase subunit alpha [bacterium]